MSTSNNQVLVAAGTKGGAAPKHSWTEEERNIVRRDYTHTRQSAIDIGLKLGVTGCAVKGQVSMMGLGANDNRHPWTPEEEVKLEKYLRRWGPRMVAHKMHRSINSVVIKAKRLHISRRCRDGWFTKRDICEILGVDHKWVQVRIDSGAIKAYYHYGTKPAKLGMSAWHIEEADLKEFIRRYPQELIARNLDIIMVVDILAGVINGQKLGAINEEV